MPIWPEGGQIDALGASESIAVSGGVGVLEVPPTVETLADQWSAVAPQETQAIAEPGAIWSWIGVSDAPTITEQAGVTGVAFLVSLDATDYPTTAALTGVLEQVGLVEPQGDPWVFRLNALSLVNVEFTAELPRTTYDDELRKIARTPTGIIILHLDTCSQVFGTSPCLATGAPCYNTLATCKFKSAYTPVTKDYRYTFKDQPLPIPGDPARPYVKSLSYLAQEILPADAVNISSKVTVEMYNEIDTDFGVDPYRVSPTLRQAPGGSAAVAAKGTYWAKFKARNPHYRNRRVTIKKGFLGLTESEYRTDYVGVLENIEVAGDGVVRVAVKGLLTLTDVDLPKKTDGRLAAAMSSGDSTFSLIGYTGVDRSIIPIVSQYAASGYLKIDTEILQYTGRTLDTTTGITTFTGVTRGRFQGDLWSGATTHALDAAVQQVEVFDSINPIDLIQTLLNRAGITNADIDTDTFTAERDTWFNGILVRAVLHEPKKVKDYLAELRAETLTVLWEGDDQKIKIRSMNPNLPGQAYRRIKDVENIVFRSRALNDHEEKRATRCAVYYDINPGKSGGSREDFARVVVVIDADAESSKEYKETKAREPIFSRWIRSNVTGDSYARILAARIIRRFRDGAKEITFDIELKDDGLKAGDIFELESNRIVDADGNPRVVRYMVTKKERIGLGRFRIRAIDTKLKGRYFFVQPTGTPNYLSATEAQRERGFISSATAVMSNGDDPYLII